jgi:hypothetical protein
VADGQCLKAGLVVDQYRLTEPLASGGVDFAADVKSGIDRLR